MSVAAKRWELAKVLDLAERLMAELRSSCSRIEVAGSVRRRVPTVGDLELVAVPLMVPCGLFAGGPQESALDLATRRLCDEGRMSRVKGGPNFQQFIVGRGERAITLDLWITTPAQWGVIFAIRTGSAAFAQSLVTERIRGGRLDEGLMVREGRVWSQTWAWGRSSDDPAAREWPDREGRWLPLSTPEERDFLELAGGWVEPVARI